MQLQESTVTTRPVRVVRRTRTRPPRRPVVPLDEDARETMKQVRVVMRTLLYGRTIEQSAGLVDVSTNTLMRILRGQNVMIGTLAKIVNRLGGQLVIHIERQGYRGRTNINP